MQSMLHNKDVRVLVKGKTKTISVKSLDLSAVKSHVKGMSYDVHGEWDKATG